MLGANFDVLRLAMQSEDLGKIGRKAPWVRGFLRNRTWT